MTQNKVVIVEAASVFSVNRGSDDGPDLFRESRASAESGALVNLNKKQDK